jgi:hypothetical protein
MKYRNFRNNFLLVKNHHLFINLVQINLFTTIIMLKDFFFDYFDQKIFYD